MTDRTEELVDKCNGENINRVVLAVVADGLLPSSLIAVDCSKTVLTPVRDHVVIANILRGRYACWGVSKG